MARRVTLTMDDRGRVTLPEGVRKKHGWSAGTTFFLQDDDGILRLVSVRNPFVSPKQEEPEREAARARLSALIDQVRSQVPAELSEEELERLIDEEIAAVRRERRARRS
jgi:bifunctional DNA-binding transcriptional regulator/antitoxin component of YhaV-PrlF toxin-antitoxin module